MRMSLVKVQLGLKENNKIKSKIWSSVMKNKQTPTCSSIRRKMRVTTPNTVSFIKASIFMIRPSSTPKANCNTKMSSARTKKKASTKWTRRRTWTLKLNSKERQSYTRMSQRERTIKTMQMRRNRTRKLMKTR